MKYGDLFTSDSNGVDFLSASEKFDVVSFKIYTINHAMVGKPWNIAQVEYSDFRLWWAIAKANNARIPMVMRDTFRVREGRPNVDNIITDFYLGRKIIIPSIADINNYINKIKSGK